MRNPHENHCIDIQFLDLCYCIITQDKPHKGTELWHSALIVLFTKATRRFFRQCAATRSVYVALLQGPKSCFRLSSLSFQLSGGRKTNISLLCEVGCCCTFSLSYLKNKTKHERTNPGEREDGVNTCYSRPCCFMCTWFHQSGSTGSCSLIVNKQSRLYRNIVRINEKGCELNSCPQLTGLVELKTLWLLITLWMVEEKVRNRSQELNSYLLPVSPV